MCKTKIRLAVEDDNDRITELSRHSVQEGMIAVFVNRTPRFNTLHRLFDAGSCHYVACAGDKITGLLGVVFFPCRVMGREHKVAYMLDLKVAKEYRGGTTAYRLLKEVERALTGSDADIVLANILKDNRKSLVFTMGKAKMPGAVSLGENIVYNILPLRKMRTGSRFRISNPAPTDIPELITLYRKYSESFKIAPVFTEDSFLFLIENIKGLSIDNFFVAREGGKIMAFAAAWDQSFYKSFQVLRLTFPIRMAALLVNFLSLFIKTPRPIRLNEPLKQLSLVLYAHDDCPEALDALFRHINNISTGGDYTLIMLHAQAADPVFRLMKKFTAVTVRSEMFMFARDTSIYPELLKNDSPVLFHPAVII